MAKIITFTHKIDKDKAPEIGKQKSMRLLKHFLTDLDNLISHHYKTKDADKNSHR